MRRKKLPPDTRLDWRDPNMPVLRIQRDGSYAEIDAKAIQNYYDQKINGPYGAPDWKHDPTYDMRKK